MNVWKFDMVERDVSIDFLLYIHGLYITQVLPIIFPL